MPPCVRGPVLPRAVSLVLCVLASAGGHASPVRKAVPQKKSLPCSPKWVGVKPVQVLLDGSPAALSKLGNKGTQEIFPTIDWSVDDWASCLDHAYSALFCGKTPLFVIHVPSTPDGPRCFASPGCAALPAGSTKANVSVVPLPACAKPKCPALPAPRTLRLDSSQDASSFVGGFSDPSTQMVQALSPGDCIDQAKAARCTANMKIGFFVFAQDGLQDSSQDDPRDSFNCAFGPRCGSLVQGGTLATIGNLALDTACPPRCQLAVTDAGQCDCIDNAVCKRDKDCYDQFICQCANPRQRPTYDASTGDLLQCK